MQLQHTVMLKLYARFTCKTYIYTLICMYKKKKGEREKRGRNRLPSLLFSKSHLHHEKSDALESR